MAMFDELRYVPVLRCKSAECMALRALFPADKQRITPLVEIPPTVFVPVKRKRDDRPKRKDPIKAVRSIVGALQQVWESRPLFLDLGLLRNDFRIEGRMPLEVFVEEARRRKLSIVPVTSIRASDEHRAAVRAVGRRSGVCIRLKEMDLILSDLKDRLRQLHTDIKVHPKRADLIVDFELCYDGATSFAEVCSMVPALNVWRSFTILSGAFAKNLADFTMNSVTTRRRSDWLRWCNQSCDGAALPRRPNFGDYTIQYAKYLEPRPGSRPSASVRYALENDWLILRGEWPGKESGPGREQYTMWARVLCSRPEFSGKDFSAGDAYIAERALDESRTGDPREWLFAGINHHMTLTVRQLSKIVGS